MIRSKDQNLKYLKFLIRSVPVSIAASFEFVSWDVVCFEWDDISFVRAFAPKSFNLNPDVSLRSPQTLIKERKERYPIRSYIRTEYM